MKTYEKTEDNKLRIVTPQPAEVTEKSIDQLKMELSMQAASIENTRLELAEKEARYAEIESLIEKAGELGIIEVVSEVKQPQIINEIIK